MNKRASSLAILVAFVSGLAAMSAPVLAAGTAPGGQALEIAPPVVTLTVNPGQTVTTRIFLRDVSGNNLLVSNQINDFVANGVDGTPKLLLNDKEKSPFSIKGWIGTLPNLNLVPKEIKSLPITISVPANASPGGHYGVIRFTGTPAGLNRNGVSLSASLGALLLITVRGHINESLAIQQFSANHGGHSGSLFESAPINFVEIFKNTGNVHVRPVGQVTVTNMFGKKVGAVNVNLPPGNVLPQSSRRFEQPLDKTVLGSKKLFGRYSAKLNVTYGSNNKVLTSSLSFWVIPYRLIALVALLLVAGFFLGRRLLRSYNQRVIERARNSRR